MTIVALAGAAALALSTSTPPMAGWSHPIRINPRGPPSCAHGLLPLGFVRKTFVGSHRDQGSVLSYVVVRAGANDQMTLHLSYQNIRLVVGRGRHVTDFGSMVFDKVEISGVCQINSNGDVEMARGPDAKLDVTVEFDQPTQYGWPSGDAYQAIQSTTQPAPKACSLKPGDWAWRRGTKKFDAFQPWIDKAGHLRFTMPESPTQTLTYQLQYVRLSAGGPICIDPDIINH